MNNFSADISTSSPDQDAFSAQDLGLEALAKLVHASLDGISIVDEEGRIVYLNPAACRICGYSLEEIRGRPFLFLISERDREMSWRSFEATSRGNRGAGLILLALVRPDGEEREAEFSGLVMEVNGRRYTAGIFRDITEERRLEREGAALVAIASKVAFGDSLQSTLDVLCRHVVEVSGAVAAAVILHDPATRQATMVGTYGLPNGFVEAVNRMRAASPGSTSIELLNAREPVFVSNARRFLLGRPEYAPLHGFMAGVTWDAFVAIPMIYRDEPVGVLISYHLPTRSIGDAEMAFHRAIANQAAIAVQNARLLAQAQARAALEQRQRLARELHDSVTQELFSIGLTVRTIAMLLEREGLHSEVIAEKMRDVQQLSKGALAEMRALIFELRPGALEEEGLLEALRKHAAAVRGREALPVDVLLDSADIPRLKPPAEEALYRIAQEAIHNVVKHARATRVEVRIAARDEHLVLRITDDGRGFDPGKVPAGHMGLGTMGERAAAIAGEYEVESKPGEGTSVTVRVPLDQWRTPPDAASSW